MKALIVAGAQSLAPRQYAESNPPRIEVLAQVPNNVAGWGRVNFAESVAPAGRTVWFDDHQGELSTGQEVNYWFRLRAGGP